MKIISDNEAQLIAVQCLQYLAGDEEQLGRFVSLSGISPNQMREEAGSTAFLVGVLDYFLADEPSLLAFTADRNLQPESIMQARQILEPTHDAFSSI